MSSTESSEDEKLQQLIESVDSEFISDSMFKNKTKVKTRKLLTEVSKASEPVHSSLPPSLRYKGDDEEEQFNKLGVTPGFQNFVAKHLERIIDSQLKEINPSRKQRIPEKPEIKDRIRLLSSSAVCLCADAEEELTHRKQNYRSQKRRQKKEREINGGEWSSSEESQEEMERLAEAAVTPSWVLEKMGAYGKCSEKGEVIQVCNKTGQGSLCIDQDVSTKKKKKKKRKKKLKTGVLNSGEELASCYSKQNNGEGNYTAKVDTSENNIYSAVTKSKQCNEIGKHNEEVTTKYLQKSSTHKLKKLKIRHN